MSMYSFIAKVLKKLGVNAYIHYYDWLTDRVTTDLDGEYDLALDFYGYSSFLTALIANEVNARRKATWLHDEDMYWLKSVERYLGSYDKVVGVSNAVRDAFIQKYPLHASQAVTIYNPIDCDVIRAKAEEFMPVEYDGRFNILTIGRLHSQKGYDVALETAKILQEKIPGAFAWYSLGDGGLKEKLEKQRDELGLKNVFYFLGTRDNPYPYMKHCDLYVQPSRHEGYVITLVEARCLESTIIASDIPSNSEQIQNGQNGLIVALDAEKLVNRICEMFHDESKRKKLAENAAKSVPVFSAEIAKIEAI